MRLIACLLPLLLVTSARAEGEADEALSQFGIALNRMGEGDPVENVENAIDNLVANGDDRAVGALVDAVNVILDREDETREKRGGVQATVSSSMERIQQLDGEIAELQARDRAGEKDLAPVMARKRREHERAMNTYNRSRVELAAIDKRIENLQRVRLRAVDAAGDAFGKVEDDAAARKLYADLAEKLPVKDTVRSLYLVRMLARSDRADAVPLLSTLLSEPGAPSGTRRLALSALAKSGTPRALEALLATWEADTGEWGAAIANVLSLAAGRPLATPAEARAWLEEHESAGDAPAAKDGD